MTKDVVHRLLNMNQPSPHKLLIRKYKSLGELPRLCDLRILRRVDDDYLPLLLAFHYCGDSDVARRARRSVEIVLHVLQNMFYVDMEKKNFSPADVKAHANKMYDVPPTTEQIKLGLYLVRELSLLSSYAETADHLSLEWLQIAERIIEIHDVSSVWDEYVSRSTIRIEEQTPPSYNLPGDEEEIVSTAQELSDLDWSIIHAEILKVSKSRFESRHYADAAEAAFKQVNKRVKEIVWKRLGKEYDGAELMRLAFSSDKPVLSFADLSTATGRNMQIGYQQIFSGSMIGIRNPNAHSNMEIDAVRSIYFIVLASLLMSLVDEALALEELPAGTVSQNTHEPAAKSGTAVG